MSRPAGTACFDRVEEAAEFDRAVALVAAADDPAGGDVQRGEQRGGAVTRVVVGAPLDLAGPHRQQRLGAVQRLDLRFLIDAQHQCMVGRVEVETDNVAHLVDKQRVLRQLEGLAAMRLQAEGAPDAPDAGGRDAAVPRHAARAPMRRRGRLALQRLHEDTLDLGVVDLTRDTRPRFVEQAVEAALDKALPPLADGLRRHPLARRYRLVAQTRGAAEHDPRPQRQGLRRLAPLRVAFQDAGNLGRQVNLRHRPTRPHPHPHCHPSPVNYYTNFWLRTLDAFV